LHTELEPLRLGDLINLHVSEQQYAYARKIRREVTVIVINNETKSTTVEFDVKPAGLGDGVLLIDKLGQLTEVRISTGKLKTTLPPRSASLFVSR
jgi:hypothetical protein